MTLYKTVPVTELLFPENEYQKVSDKYWVIYKGQKLSAYYRFDAEEWYENVSGIEIHPTHYLLPVGEEKLRRLCEEVRKKVMEANYEYGIGKTKNPKTSTDTAITSLIDKFLKDEL